MTPAADYAAWSAQIDLNARQLPVSMPLTYRIAKRYAHIAWRASRAETIDPEPGLAPCGICQGVTLCYPNVHLEVDP